MYKMVRTQVICDIIIECEKYIKKSNRLSLVYKYTNIIFNVIIILSSLTVLFDAIFQNNGTLQIASGVIIGILRSISSVFSFEEKGLCYKILYIKYKKILRKLNSMIELKMSRMDVNNILTRVQQELDDLEINMYSGISVLQVAKNSPV